MWKMQNINGDNLNYCLKHYDFKKNLPKCDAIKTI